ncbi:transcriptional regulator, LacI family [Streptomyces sp. WMMB 714]|jgi:LacI family transcriptional regulator|uniref:LacI family DNA-binding transcriptional regulator n=1 Tax=Streptomyces sp. WMMB 714 TaxID=1286822 RepID=UPI000823A984|nr:LacI family DNA-binding transcriptional regulator [Streptomyces sp. WMMB 714]SCK05679.1 transcriptional regulator, LacI family [Streptomyces sp. WMMB 714]
MKDVAAHVGTSIKSVSRVLNGEEGVSAATKERILQAMAELGFRRNDLARGLRQSDRTRTVGLALPQAGTRFHDSLVHGIDEIAAAHGSLVLTASSRTAARERETLVALCSRRVDGLIVVPAGEDHAFLRPEQHAGVPVVFVDRPPHGIEADTVLTDHAGGARDATEHLLRQGHTRIGVIGADARIFSVAERIEGHLSALSALRAREAPAHRELMRLGAESAPEALEACLDLFRLPEPPTALFTLNNQCTIGAARALRGLGRSDEVALVGFDDFETADLIDPPVTVIAQDAEEIGRTAARLMFERMAGHSPAPGRSVLPTRLIVRGSGEIPLPVT